MNWTDERIAFLKEKWGEGWSLSQLANHLGITRNAAAGKLSRLGLMGDKLKPKPQPRPRKESQRKIKLAIAVAEEKEIVVGGISLYDLTNTTCRWPSGYPVSFCGATCDAKKPYCEDHTQLATRQ